MRLGTRTSVTEPGRSASLIALATGGLAPKYGTLAAQDNAIYCLRAEFSHVGRFRPEVAL